MKRTFNYTGRKKINRKDVGIRLSQVNGSWVFDAEIHLSEYHFARTAEIWFEAYRQNLWMQWAWGTIATPIVPLDRKLSEFDDPTGVLFRVRVVHPPGPEHHKIIGEADGIPFVKAGEADDRRRHLLNPIPDNLEHELWRLDFSDDSPRFLVNKDAKPSWEAMARLPQFLALVYPEVTRRILMRILLDSDQWSEDDDEEGWKKDWIQFAKMISGQGPVPAGKQEREDWIQDAVAALARKHQLRTAWDLSCEDEERT